MVQVPSIDLTEIRRLYDLGLYGQAHEVAKRHGPLRRWEGTDARLIAGRLAVHLGATRMGRGLHVLAWRRDRGHAEAAYYCAHAVLERRGPLEALDFMRAAGDWPGAEARMRADWLALRARLASIFRDFDAAEDLLAKAESLAPSEAWVLVERCEVRIAEDRYEEALAAAREALRRRPWYRPAVQACAHVLQLLDRDEEAAELLREACGRVESAYLRMALAEIESERERPGEALACLAGLEALLPLMEPELRGWLSGRRANLAYLSGDLAEAARWARDAGHPLAERYANPPPDRRRVRLAVPFVRQHHMTCSPATLSAVARFWGKPADHLQVAEAICYDGTPSHGEREWAERSGWAVREFTVTWEAAVALLDRGVPFTLTVVAPEMGHLQAVVGYDSLRRTFLIRDPYRRHYEEATAEGLLARHRATGPRGMVLVPLEKAALVEGIDLPEAALYDRFTRLQGALMAHDRDRAAAEEEAIAAAAPGHRLALRARASMASYDGNRAEHLACVEKLVAAFPDDLPLQLARLALLRDLSRGDERMSALRALAGPDAHPAVLSLLARELQSDMRRAGEAERLFRRALRLRGPSGADLHGLAGLLWDRRRFEEGTELFRLAACLEDKDEGLASSYFIASRRLRREEEALSFLERRFERFGRKSGLPAQTLFTSLRNLDRDGRAFEVLERALALRPEDGDLLLFACGAHAARGEVERARALLGAAEPRAGRAAWLRASADLATSRGEHRAALTGWRHVLEEEPLALDAHRAVARLLAMTESTAAALEHLRAATERFPHHAGLHGLRVEWLRDEEAGARVEGARRLVAVSPSDAWARRELALALALAGAAREAFVEAETARRLEPANSWSHSVLGELHASAGRIEQARAAYRMAVRLWADHAGAIVSLADLAATAAERRREMEYVRGELERQAHLGGGLAAWADTAAPALGREELVASLTRLRDQRPELVETWTTLARALLDADRRDEAHAAAREAAARFPLATPAWRALAAACRARLDAAGEIEALERALAIDPACGPASRDLAAAHERSGWLTKSRTVLEQAIAHAPLDPVSHGAFAELLWGMGEREAAVERMRRAVAIEPGYERGWSTLCDWAGELRRPEIAEAPARELSERRPGEARSWLIVARVLSRREDAEARLAALDRAIALSARLFEAHDLKAMLLAELGRYDEAVAACRAPVWNGAPPVELRGREAWIAAERGDLKGARERMRAVLGEHPNYGWGWRQMASWAEALEDWEGAREASERMAALAPQNPVAHGYLGDALWRLGDRAGAKRALRRAVDLAPDYPFAGMKLLDLHLEDGELDAAAEVLQIARPHLELAVALARDTQIAARRGDRDPAMKAFARLCVEPGADRGTVETALKALDDAGWPAAADELLEGAIAGSGAAEGVGWAWADRACKAARSRAVRARLESLGDGAWPQAVSAYLEWAVRAKNAGAARELVRRLGGRLARDRVAWGMAGYALYSLDRFREAAAWFDGWRGRQGLEPWMLMNLTLTMRALGREEEAAEATRRAAELPPDHSSAMHELLAALDDAVAGEAERALARVRRREGDALEPFYACVRDLARATARYHADGDFAAARRGLAEAMAGMPSWREDPVLARAYRACVRSVARRRGGLAGAAWRLFARW